MYLVASLGNPSPKYDGTRHSVGHVCVAKWLKTVNAVPANVPTIKQGVYAVNINDEKIIIVNDLGAYMNETGPAIAAVTNFFKIPAENLILAHDDTDLPLGALRVSKDSAGAGHRGVESVITALGTKNFTRLRLGIESRVNKNIPPTEDFVLQKFPDSEAPLMKEMVNRGVTAINSIITNDPEQAMNEFNKT